MKKKTIETKIVEKFLDKEYVLEIIKEINTTTSTFITGLEHISRLSEEISTSLLSTYAFEITEMVGQRALELKKLRKEVVKQIKPFLEEYLDTSAFAQKETKMKI